MNPAPNSKIARSADAKLNFGHRLAGGVSAADLVLRNQTRNLFCPVTSDESHVTRCLTHAVFFLSPVTRHGGGSSRPGVDIPRKPPMNSHKSNLIQPNPTKKNETS